MLQLFKSSLFIMNIRGKKILKLLDKYLGIPILFALLILKTKKVLPKDIKKIGVLTVPALGDIILINGLLSDIKSYDKKIKIILFVSKEVKETAELMSEYDLLVNIEIYNLFSAINTLRSNPVDIFIDASQWSKFNAILTFFSKSKFKIGFRTKGQCKHLIFDYAPEHSPQIHELFNYKKLSFIPEIATNNLPRLKLNSEISVIKDRIVIHTMPSGYLSVLKEWPGENWAIIIEFLLARKYEIFFTGSGSDRKSIDALLLMYKKNHRLYNVAGKYSIKETAYLIKNSRLVISVNTGIMHLASVIGCNLIALHGPTDPKRWGPLNENSRIIKSNYPEAPCLNLGFEYKCNDRTGECMKRITPEMVISEIKEFGL